MDNSRIINFNEFRGYPELLSLLKTGKTQSAISLPRSVRLPFLAEINKELNAPIVFITSKSTRLRVMHEEFGFWSGDKLHLLFEEPNALFYEKGNWTLNTRRERISVLSALAEQFIPHFKKKNRTPVIFSSAKSVMTRTIPRRKFIKHYEILKISEEYQIEDLVSNWVFKGYENTNIVVNPGQFSRRGGLLDIWPITDEQPVRIEFFGNKVDTLRFFHPASQRSIERIETVYIPPSSEAVYSDKTKTDKNSQVFSEFDIPYLYQSFSSILDYLPSEALIMLDNAASIQACAEEIEIKAEEFKQENIQNGFLEKEYPSPYITWSEIIDSISRLNVIDLGYPVEMNEHLLSESFSPSPRFGGQMDDFLNFIEQNQKQSKKIFVISKQIERLEELKTNRNRVRWDETKIDLIQGSVSGGWRAVNQDEEITYLFSDQEIFGWKRPLPRLKRTKNYESPEFSYADLQPGDLVVHVDYGIGRFDGLVRRSLGGVERDYLKVLYAKDDELFVPVHQADRLTLYIGPDARIPRLSNFGSSDWEEKKKKVSEAVERVASDLLELYAHRQSAEGFSYSKDSDWQRILESSFPHTETIDQILAINKVKKDMEFKRPMDRLLCGDVGYGKTEVALRAAFKAVMDGKQVAMLVPTTILAQQHFDTFLSRLVPFPVKVEMLSRFRTAEEQEQVLQSLEKSEIDIIIGTHRLLQQDVKIPELGLLIIDEEQRFGVSHKEFFKHMRKEVDVLTLTATPIPRTLYMALSGIRDISVINTAPSDRIPIHTYIGEYDPDIVRRAIMREIGRGGQVFFVHNRVKTISAMSAQLRHIVPEARIGIAHGQMKEKMLASVMKKFNSGEIDVLLSTSIIESGLDIPNANTLIVDRGDTFGLAQLYQLRGRVGRGSSRAYAYLFYHKKKKPTPGGIERLETIAENSQLGAGYSIAMRDLEMRGAGELLGTQQHGHIAAVGFHLYTRFLAMAISDKKQFDKVPNDITKVKESLIRPLVTLDLPIYAGIPKEYIPNDQQRVNMYRRISDISSMGDAEQLRLEFIDRFGNFGKEIENLLWLLKLKILSINIGISAIALEGTSIVIRFPTLPDGKHSRNLPDLGKSTRTGKNGYWIAYDVSTDWQSNLMKIMVKLQDRILEMKENNEI